MATYNITTALTQELISEESNSGVSKINLCNIHATDSCAVDLYVEKKLTGKFYILKGLTLPVNTTLSFDLPNVSFKKNQYGLFVKLSAADSAVDIIIS